MPTTYGFTGSKVTHDLPDGAAEARIELIGAGGKNRSGISAGTGGYVEVYVDVSSLSALDLWVGGGEGNQWGRSNGGSGGLSTAGDGGAGGGSTEVWGDGSLIAAADAGGGTGGSEDAGSDGGGGGGGARGGNGGDGNNPGDDAQGSGSGGNGGVGEGGLGGRSGGNGGQEIGSAYPTSNATTNSGGGNNGNGQIVVEITQIAPLNTPANVSVDASRETEVDLSWDAVADAEEYDVYRHNAGDPYAEGSVIATVAGTSYTDTGLTNGRQYHYQIVAVDTTAQRPNSDPSAEVIGTTVLPPTEIDTTTSAPTSIDISWGKADNNPDGDWQIRRDGAAIDTTALGTPTYTDTGLTQGTTYEYVIRRRTPDATADSAPVTGTTGLSPPSNVTAATGDDDTRITVTWTDETGGAATGYQIDVAIGGRTIDEATLAGDATSWTSDDIVPNRDNAGEVTVTVTATTEDTASEGTTTTAAIPTIGTSDKAWTAALRLDGQLRQIGADGWTATPSWRSEPSAITTWQASIPWDTSLEDWMRSDAFIYFADRLLLRGELHNPTSTDGDGTTQLSGKDVIAQLDRGGTAETYESIEAWRAVADYEDQYLEEWDVTVHEPDADIVDDGLAVQDSVSETFSAPSDMPIEFDGNGDLGLLQSCWPMEFEDADRLSGATNRSDPDYSGGTATEFDSSGSAVGDQWREFDFSTEHTIPDGAFGCRIRFETLPNNEAGHGFDVELELESDDTATTIADDLTRLGGEELGWLDIVESDPGEIPPGTHTIRVERSSINDDAGVGFDLLAPYDARYSYTFDNNVDADNALDGPERYPDAIPVEGVAFDQSWNIVEATASVSMSDVSNGQAIEVSNDDGDSYHPQDGSESNTESVTHEFDDPGTVVRGRVTLSRHSPNGKRAETPAYGYAGQTLQSWELSITTNDIGVIDEEEFVGSHWENWQLLHERAGMVFVPQYDAEAFLVDSFVAGEVTREADWRTLDHTRDPDTTDYANQLTAYGAVDEEADERITATAEVADEVEAYDAIPGTPLFEAGIENEERLRNVVRRELGSLVEEGSLKGSVEIVPKPLRPGFGYVVPELDDDTLALWGVQFDDSGGSSGSLEFGEPEDLASVLTSIRVDVRQS